MGLAGSRSSEAGGSVAPLCDGAEELKLRVFMAAQNGRELRGSIVRVENGHPSLAVDGQCNYWINGGWFNDANSRDLGWRYGRVDSALQQVLERAYPLDLLETLQDCGSSIGAFDADKQIIASRNSRAWCDVPGPRFRAAWEVIALRAAALWQQGRPMTGPMWVTASESDDDLESYAWPLVEPLGPFLIAENVPEPEYQGLSSGVAHLVSAPEAVLKLRTLRERYLQDSMAQPTRFFDTPKVTDGKIVARLYMRDSIPYENERGLLPFVKAQ